MDISKIKDYSSSLFKELSFFLLLLCIYIVFSDFIMELFYENVAEPVLSKVNKGKMLDIMFFVLAIMLSYKFYRRYKKGYYVRLSECIICCMVIWGYLDCRMQYNALLLSLLSIEYVKYFDLILIYFSLPVFLKCILLFKRKRVSLNLSSLYSDNHIKYSSQDILGRTEAARRIFREIKELDTNYSTAIGVVGEWGNGKTSFLWMVREQFEKENNNIIVEFNPWLNISAESILQDFFNTLEMKVKEYSVDISKDINKYSNSVLDIPKNNISDSILRATNIVFGKSLTEDFEKMNILLKKLDKRIIIFIDDLDRLQSNEIFEILKLIRNTAGFDNFIYVVAYDKDYLIKSLEMHKIPNAAYYTEKIFLKEFKLLPVTVSQISAYIKNELMLQLPGDLEKLDEIFEGIFNSYFPFASTHRAISCLTNIRDAKRFLNSFITDYKQISDQIDLRDYLMIKLLKFKFYEVYILLFNRKNHFIESEDVLKANNKNKKYILKKSEKDNATRDYYNIFNGTVLEKYLIEAYDQVELESISAICNILFSKSAQFENTLSMAYEVNFYRYYKDEMDESDLSIVDFKKAMSSSETIQADLQRWNDEGKILNVKFYLHDIDVLKLSDIDEYENYIKAMFFIANLGTIDFYGRETIVGFDFDVLLDKLMKKRNKIIEMYYHSEQKQLEFIYSILSQARAPFLYESEFCYNLMKRYGDALVPKNKLELFLVGYLEKYSEIASSFDDNFWDLYHNCKSIKWIPAGGNSHKMDEKKLDEANQILKKFAIAHLDEFLVIIIETKSFYGTSKEDSKVKIRDFALDPFGGFDNFINILKSQKLRNEVEGRSFFLDEFVKFAEKYSIKKSFVSFKFTFPPALQKLENISNQQS